MKYRRVTLSLALCAALLGVGSTATASGKCSRLNATKSVSGVRYVCTKKGKGLVWVKSASNVATITSTIASVSDSLNFKNPMIYGIKDSLLTRRADSGTYFETDSRKPEAFSTIRQKAFAELNPPALTLSHPNIEFVYDIRPSFPTMLIDYIKREFSGAAALWNDLFQSGTRVRVSLVTEKDRDFIKNDRWLQQNLPANFDRFDAKSERPFITGGGGYWDRDGGDWTGNIFLSTASYVDLTFINYEWPQVARHEFFHVVQDYAMFKSRRARPNSQADYNKIQPLHFREGGANAVGYLTAFRNSGWSSDAMDWVLWARRRCCGDGWISVRTTDDAIRMMVATEDREPSQAFEMSYALGAVMYEWLIATYGLDGFKKLLNQLATSPSFNVALQNSVGLTQAEFYAKSAPYVLSAFRNTDP